jgi:hypothetical protein
MLGRGRSISKKAEMAEKIDITKTRVLLLISPLARGLVVFGSNLSISASYRSFTTHESRAEETEKATKIRNLPSTSCIVNDERVTARKSTIRI